MSDPLSIAASIAGLITTAGYIVAALSAFAGAPQSARDALQAVREIRLLLTSASSIIDRISERPPELRALIRLDHIAITFASCVLTMSELESLVCGTSKEDDELPGSGSVLYRSRWLWIEKRVLRLLLRLESQKSSLSFMLNVFIWFV
jgi:hypothetical protein